MTEDKDVLEHKYDNEHPERRETSMSIQVREVSVSTDWGENEVSIDDLEFDSIDDLWKHIDEEYGDVDVNNRVIRDQYGDDDIIINGDVWFVRYQIM